ncbi:MAG: NAD(P)-binding domain-containing protein [Bacteroidota bacterium]|nr:NAD(P)-binding domain-containing protein [Bacteroidota bacterium]
MNIGILGSGIVGQTLGSGLVTNGHKVMLGSRDAASTNAIKWAETNDAQHGTFSEAAAFADVLFNCTMGAFSLEAIKLAGEGNFRNKILIDVANPIDFSRGMPPRLTIGNDNSLGEEIQKLLPETKVVKALNTINYELMVNPGQLNNGHIDLFICGNDEAAKITVTELLVKEFAWKRECIVDLGEIKHARSTESMLLFLISLTMKYGTFKNGIKIHRC